MTTPMPRQREFAALRQAVSTVAAHALETAHPEFAARFRTALQSGADLNRALEAAGRLPDNTPFSSWRRILTTFVEQEMAATQVRTALHMMRTAVPPDLQDVTGTMQGAWIVYHVQAALTWLSTAAEGARRLVGMLYRTCVRPFDLEWNPKSAAAIRPLTELAGRIEAMRERLTDEGWTARALEREQIWDGVVLGTRPLGTWAVWYYAAQFRRTWFRELDNLARQFFWALERASARLLVEVHWEALG